MKKIIARNGLLTIIFFLLSLIFCIGISYAVDPFTEVTQEIQIDIHYPEKEQEFLNSLIDKLHANRFDNVNYITYSPDINPREYLENSNSTQHLITNFIFDDSGQANSFSASIYSPYIQDPEVIQRSSKSYLINEIIRYIKSNEAFNLRDRNPRIKRDSYAQYIHDGRKYYLEDDFDRAIKAFQAAEKEDPSQPESYLGFSAVYREQGDLATSRSYIKKGLEQTNNQNNPSLRNEEALIYKSERKYDEAIRILEKLPIKEEYQINLALTLIESNRIEQGRKVLNQILEDDDLSEQFRPTVQRKLEELEIKETLLAKTRKVLWLAFTGLICITIISLITILIRKSSAELMSAQGLSPKDLIAFRLEIAIALISGLFSVLLLILPRFLGS